MLDKDILNTKPIVRKDLKCEFMVDGMVIHEPGSGLVHNLNETATLIWDFCDGQHSLKEMIDWIAEELGIDEERLKNDVVQTISEFDKKNLLSKLD